MIPKWLRFILPILLIFIVTVGMVHRIGMERSGRRVNLISPECDNFYRLKKVEDFVENGELSLVSGKEIMDFYRAQIPVNPHIFAQLRALKVDTEKTYLITDRRQVFELLEDSLPGVRVYLDRFERSFDGNYYPDAFILTSFHSKEELKSQPLARVHRSARQKKGYLYLASKNEVDLFFSGRRPEVPLNLIVYSGYDKTVLPERFLPQIKNIYVIGIDIQQVGKGQPLATGGLNFTTASVPGSCFRGGVKPLGRWFISALLLLAALITTYIGFVNDTRPLAWGGWLLVFLLALFLADTHLFALGLLIGGLFKIACCRGMRGIIWATLAGLLVYGFQFTPYLLFPAGQSSVFWGGFIAAQVFMIPFSGRWKRNIITAEDVLFLFLIVFVARSLYYLSGVQINFFLLNAESWLLIFTPLLAYFFSDRRNYSRYLFLAVILGWFFLLAVETGIVVLIGFIIAMIIYVLYLFYLI
jgi:hypothetical protein